MKNESPAPSEMADIGARNAWKVGRKRLAWELPTLILSGLAMALAMPGWNLSFFVWFSLIPLIALCARASLRRAFLYGLLWGYCWNTASVFFLHEIMGFIPWILGLVLGLFCAVWAMLIPAFFRNLLYPRSIRVSGGKALADFYAFPVRGELLCTFGLACWWILMEWLRSNVFTGFPWNLLAASQWQNPEMIQVCEYTGIYGVSFLLVYMNLGLYFAIHGLAKSIPRGTYKRPYPLITAFVLIMISAYAGSKALEARKSEFKESNHRLVAAGVVQTNLTQRRDGDESRAREALDQCIRLTDELLTENEILRKSDFADLLAPVTPTNDRTATQSILRELKELDFIVWPESAVPRMYYGSSPLSEEYRERVRALLRRGNVPLILGTITFGNVKSPTEFDLFNSAVLLKNNDEKSGNPLYDLADTYSKVHLVPYGEFVPLGKHFPKLIQWVGMGRDLQRGASFRPLEPAPGIRAGTLICYEDVFPYAARAQALSKANFLLVITNDAWYPKSSEPQQHFANAIFRAIETRLPMLRCGNSDYSVLIDPRGIVSDAVMHRPAADGTEKPAPEIKGEAARKIFIPVPLRHTPTFYTRFGDVFVAFCFAGFLFAAACLFVARLRFAHELNAPLDDARNQLRENFLKSAVKK